MIYVYIYISIVCHAVTHSVFSGYVILRMVPVYGALCTIWSVRVVCIVCHIVCLCCMYGVPRWYVLCATLARMVCHMVRRSAIGSFLEQITPYLPIPARLIYLPSLSLHIKPNETRKRIVLRSELI